jgi:hypothetical protein
MHLSDDDPYPGGWHKFDPSIPLKHLLIEEQPFLVTILDLADLVGMLCTRGKACEEAMYLVFGGC